MANYPTNVWSPSVKNAGDTIQASHIDDLQTEVVAIESGLTQGTAQLNSSNSTVVNLSVTGGSTLAGALNVAGGSTVATLSVTGGSTFGGAVTFAGTVNAGALVNGAACRLTNTTDQALNSTGVWVGLNWDTEASDGSGMHSTATNSSRITFAASSGLYLVGVNAQWSQVAAGSFQLRLVQNDVTAVGGQAMIGGMPTPFFGHGVTAVVRAVSTSDYVTVQAFIGQSTSAIVGSNNAASTIAGTAFWAAKVS